MPNIVEMTKSTDLLRAARTLQDLLAVSHPHIAKVESGKGLSVLFGILTAKSRKIEVIESVLQGKSETVGLYIEPQRFMLSIGNSFVLLTLQDQTGRHPVIQKSWRRVKREVGKGITADLGSEDTYIDAENMCWIHRYRRRGEPDELSAFDASGEESLHIVMETTG
jgi:hypothetical protein